MNRLIYIIAIILILAACAGGGRERAALDAAQSVINHRPDSALAILDSLEPSSQEFSRSTLRRWQLLRLMAQNKCDTVFRSDSLQRVLTSYYDRHGTPNEQMWAHYLLGRAYHDMGEAPLAQKAFWDAAERADTSSADCDYWNLCRVYFQLSDIQHQSMLPEEMLKSLALAQTNAEKAGDTISLITAIGKRTLAYELLDNADSIIHYAQESSRLFLMHGQTVTACQYLSIAIPSLIKKGNIAKASECISLYEKYSGYFDDNNCIQEGREIYYHTKGLYYIESLKLDSAELMFRKLLSLAKNANDIHAAYLGLRDKYRISGHSDSLAKYAFLSEQYDDSLYLQRYRSDLLRSQQIFNYTRFLRASEESALESERKSKVISLIAIAFFLLSLIFTRCYFHFRMRRKELLMEYKDIMNQLDEVKREKASAISEKEKETDRLTQKIRNIQVVLGRDVEQDLEHQIACSIIVKRIKDAAAKPSMEIEEKDWQDLDRFFDKEYPNFRATLSRMKVSGTEYRLCQLARIGLSPSSISMLLNKDPSYASTVRRRLYNHAMKTTGRAKDWDNFLFSIPRA